MRRTCTPKLKSNKPYQLSTLSSDSVDFLVSLHLDIWLFLFLDVFIIFLADPQLYMRERWRDIEGDTPFCAKASLVLSSAYAKACPALVPRLSLFSGLCPMPLLRIPLHQSLPVTRKQRSHCTEVNCLCHVMSAYEPAGRPVTGSRALIPRPGFDSKYVDQMISNQIYT